MCILFFIVLSTLNFTSLFQKEQQKIMFLKSVSHMIESNLLYEFCCHFFYIVSCLFPHQSVSKQLEIKLCLFCTKIKKDKQIYITHFWLEYLNADFVNIS